MPPKRRNEKISAILQDFDIQELQSLEGGGKKIKYLKYKNDEAIKIFMKNIADTSIKVNAQHIQDGVIMSPNLYFFPIRITNSGVHYYPYLGAEKIKLDSIPNDKQLIFLCALVYELLKYYEQDVFICDFKFDDIFYITDERLKKMEEEEAARKVKAKDITLPDISQGPFRYFYTKITNYRRLSDMTGTESFSCLISLFCEFVKTIWITDILKETSCVNKLYEYIFYLQNLKAYFSAETAAAAADPKKLIENISKYFLLQLCQTFCKIFFDKTQAIRNAVQRQYNTADSGDKKFVSFIKNYCESSIIIVKIQSFAHNGESKIINWISSIDFKSETYFIVYKDDSSKPMDFMDVFQESSGNKTIFYNKLFKESNADDRRFYSYYTLENLEHAASILTFYSQMKKGILYFDKEKCLIKLLMERFPLRQLLQATAVEKSECFFDNKNSGAQKAIISVQKYTQENIQLLTTDAFDGFYRDPKANRDKPSYFIVSVIDCQALDRNPESILESYLLKTKLLCDKVGYTDRMSNLYDIVATQSQENNRQKVDKLYVIESFVDETKSLNKLIWSDPSTIYNRKNVLDAGMIFCNDVENVLVYLKKFSEANKSIFSLPIRYFCECTLFVSDDGSKILFSNVFWNYIFKQLEIKNTSEIFGKEVSGITDENGGEIFMMLYILLSSNRQQSIRNIPNKQERCFGNVRVSNLKKALQKTLEEMNKKKLEI